MSDLTIVPYLTSVTNNFKPSLKFTYQLLLDKPELFKDTKAVSSLFYILYCGNRFKPEPIYEQFASFIKNRNIDYIRMKLQGKTPNMNLFDNSTIIMWARDIQTNKAAIEWEPAMKGLIAAMNVFLENPIVEYNGKMMPLTDFHPIAYTRNGENILNLIPYIAYIMSFLINCQPFSFDETMSSTSVFEFLDTVNAWLNAQYVSFGRDYNINVIETNLDQLIKNNTIPAERFTTFFNTVLDPVKITSIRNTILNKEPGLMAQSVADQEILTSDDFNKMYNITVNKLIEILVENNPFATTLISDGNYPRFNQNYINLKDVAILTAYSSFKTSHFSVDSFGYVWQNEPRVGQLPKEIFTKDQDLPSKIKKFNDRNPMTHSDIISDIMTSYLYKKLEEKAQENLFDDPSPVTIAEDDLRNNQTELWKWLLSFYVQGSYAPEFSTICRLFSIIAEHGMKYELADIPKLCDMLNFLYDNRLGAIITPAYLMYILPELALKHLNAGHKIETFSLFSVVFEEDLNYELLYKFSSLVNTFLYIQQKNYISFADNVLTEAYTLCFKNPDIVIPYIKGLDDDSDIYAIGGLDLQNYASYSNPLIRGYGFVAHMFGTCEALEIFHHHIKSLENTALFELINQNKDNIGNIESALNNTDEKSPIILSDYDDKFEQKRFNKYYLKLTDSAGNSILKVLLKYCFKQSIPTNYVQPDIWTKSVKFGSEYQVSKAEKNSFLEIYPINLLSTGVSYEMPFYDIKSVIKVVTLSISPVPGKNRIEIPLISYDGVEKHTKNAILWIFSDLIVEDKYSRYQTLNNDTAPAVTEGAIIDRVVATNSINNNNDSLKSIDLKNSIY